MEYAKRYTAAFMYVLSTPFNVQVVHQDGNFPMVNNKQVVPEAYHPEAFNPGSMLPIIPNQSNLTS